MACRPLPGSSYLNPAGKYWISHVSLISGRSFIFLFYWYLISVLFFLLFLSCFAGPPILSGSVVGGCTSFWFTPCLPGCFAVRYPSRCLSVWTLFDIFATGVLRGYLLQINWVLEGCFDCDFLCLCVSCLMGWQGLLLCCRDFISECFGVQTPGSPPTSLGI